jgi:lysophospholipase L1-like esterase
MTRLRSIVLSAGLTLVSDVVCVLAGEVLLRMMNSSMRNYDIEMWRYARELKVKVDDPALDFDHARNKDAILQGVSIRLNGHGLRGPEPENQVRIGRRILVLGGSITLGWGVAEAETVSSRLQAMLARDGRGVEVLNGGVGNYNATRYVARFFKQLTDLRPSDILVLYFPRDAEELAPGQSSVVLRNSELAVTLWIAARRLFDRAGEQSLVEHYQAAYRPDAAGYLRMKDELKRLSAHAAANDIRIHLAMVPDFHGLRDYKLGFVHTLMEKNAAELGYRFIDLLPALQGRRPEEIWAMPGDPHPNALGHKLMAETILPKLLTD